MVKNPGLQTLVFSPARLIGNVMASLAGRTMTRRAWAYVDAVDAKGEESHGRLVRNWEIDSGHHIMNTEEGKKVEAMLWSETMEELERVAGVRAFLGVQQQ